MKSVSSASYATSVRMLRTAQKSNRGAPLYSRVVNRPLGRLLAAAAFRARMSPNQVTVASAAATFTGILCVASLPPSPGMAVTVGLLLVLGYALDSADGQLARLRGGGSPAGEWLDHVADSAKHATIHLAVLISLYRFSPLPSDLVLLLPLAFSAVASVQFFCFMLTEKVRKPAGPTLASQEPARPSMVRSVLTAPNDYGLLCVAFLTFAVTPVFLAIYGVLLLGSAGYLALALPKWFRDVSSAEA